jgi:hypothetical protein
MSEEDTMRFFTFVAYLLAALSVFLMGYLAWRRVRRRRHRHHRVRPRWQQHRDTWG